MPERPPEDFEVTEDERTTLIPAQSNSHDPLVGMKLDGRFLLERPLGRGGMATVYLARNRGGGRVAVKVISPRQTNIKDIRKRCKLEALALTEITSSHVVRAFDSGELPDGKIYIVMEYLAGEDLEALIKREGSLDWQRAARMTRMICAGLAAAHKLQLIHRDVKPPNCFRVTVDGDEDHIKLIDFGIAKEMGTPSTAAGVTEEGTLLGTIHYVAPELVRGKPPSVQSDLYAVGVTLFKLLTGEVPFPGSDHVDVWQRHCFEAVVPPSTRMPEKFIPPALDSIVLRALAKEPEQRYQSANALLRDIDDVLRAHDVASCSPASAEIITGPLPQLVEFLSPQNTVFTPVPPRFTPVPPPDTQTEGVATVMVSPLQEGVAARGATLPVSRGAPAPQVATTVGAPASPPSWNVPPHMKKPSTAPAPPSIQPAVPAPASVQTQPIRAIGRREKLSKRLKLFTPLVCAVIFGLGAWILAPEVPAKPLEAPAPRQDGSAEPAPTPLIPVVSILTKDEPDTVPDPTPVALVTPIATTTKVEPKLEPTRPENKQPEPNFDYKSAGVVIQEQESYIVKTCLSRGNAPAPWAKARESTQINVVVRRSGKVHSVHGLRGPRELRKCLSALIKTIPFDESPRGGAFVYSYPSGHIKPVPLPDAGPPAQEAP